MLKTAFEKHNIPSFNKKAHSKYHTVELKTFKLACTYTTKYFYFLLFILEDDFQFLSSYRKGRKSLVGQTFIQLISTTKQKQAGNISPQIKLSLN